MITHSTKYDVGELVYWVHQASDGIYEIRKDPIRGIHIGGKAYERYQIAFTNRGEKDVFKTFKEAKMAAVEDQKAANEKAMATVESYEEKQKLY